MRRRILLVALWLAGTIGATGVVFTAVSRLGTDLAEVNNKYADTPRRSAGSTLVTAVAPTTAATVTTTTEPPTTTQAEPTTVAAPAPTPVTEPVEVDGPTTTVRRGPTATTVGRGPTATAPPTTPTTPAPPAPTVAPPTVPPTAPPTTAPPPTTVPVQCEPDFARVGRAGRLDFNACTDGIRLLAASPAPGWTQTVLSYGPPIVAVRFTQNGVTVSCTVSGTIDGVTTDGDC